MNYPYQFNLNNDSQLKNIDIVGSNIFSTFSPLNFSSSQYSSPNYQNSQSSLNHQLIITKEKKKKIEDNFEQKLCEKFEKKLKFHFEKTKIRIKKINKKLEMTTKIFNKVSDLIDEISTNDNTFDIQKTQSFSWRKTKKKIIEEIYEDFEF